MRILCKFNHFGLSKLFLRIKFFTLYATINHILEEMLCLQVKYVAFNNAFSRKQTFLCKVSFLNFEFLLVSF